MKIDEFNIPFTKTVGGQSKEEIAASKTFINNFIGRVSADIAKGIKAKVINPTNTITTTKPAATATTAPTASGVAQSTPAQVRQQKQAAAAKIAQQQMAGGTTASAKTSTAKPTTKLELVPKDLELMPKESKSMRTMAKENKYHKLNTILENIINFDDFVISEQAAYTDTISSFVQNMVKQYVGNIDTSKYDAKIKELANKIEQEYNSMNPMLRGGRKSLTELANIIYLITSGALQSQQMSQKSQAFSNAASKNLVQLLRSDPDALGTTILNAINMLKKVKPQEYAELMQALKTPQIKK